MAQDQSRTTGSATDALPVTNLVDEGIFLEVEDGLFETKSIVGDEFALTPKEFEPNVLTKCVYRKDHITTIVRKLQVMVKQEHRNLPGLYLSGPAGVGKSVLIYTLTQIAKFCFNWLTVYLPNCRRWRKEKVVAMGYFLDRVLDAFSTNCLQQKFPKIWDLLRCSQTELEQLEPGGDHWETAAKKKGNKSQVEEAYSEVMQFLERGTNDTPVLLVFDEVNALWDGKGGLFDETPWEITDFSQPRLRHGALLVAGTTDCEFQETIPAGYDRKCVYRITELEPEETEIILNTKLGLPLKRIRELDEKLWHEIFDASGNIPRELAGFAHCLEDLSSRIEPTWTDEPARKKLKVEIAAAIKERREENRSYHHQSVIHVIKRDQEKNIKTFEDALFAWCQNYFLMNEPHGQLEILRVPNFIVTNGATMRPTTVDASRAYFDWFLNECEKRPKAKLPNNAHNLAIISAPESDVNVRGHAFERYLSSTLTLAGRDDFRLPYHLLNEAPGQTHSVRFQVTNRVYAKADIPPKNFRNFPTGTLLTHVARDGVGMMLHLAGEVIYLEATVGDYRATKLPTMDDGEGRATLILETIRKWLGQDVYNVTVDEASQLSVTYRSEYTSRSTVERPDPPTVHYVVVTTCPSSLRPAADRKKKYNWIKVCCLDDLITSGIIPESSRDLILNAQALNACGRLG